MAQPKKLSKTTNPRDRRTPDAHSPGLLDKMTTTKGTGRVAHGASPEYRPTKDINKLMKAAYGPEWRPKGYKKRK